MEDLINNLWKKDDVMLCSKSLVISMSTNVRFNLYQMTLNWHFSSAFAIRLIFLPLVNVTL